MGDDGASSPVASRRRLVFRPPQQLQNQAKVEDSAHSNQAGPSNEALIEEATKKKAVKSWTMEDIMAYYDGLKMHGKDFESVAKMLAKKKIMKDKDQIKNYFYNSLKIIKQILSIDEDDMGDVPKDAKELFLALNACEWKKRTNNGKISSDKLKELLLEGVTTVRMNKKTLQIKTPPCPSLVRWFTKSRRAEKVPSEIYLELKPKSYRDESLMRSRSQNPLMRVKISINEKLYRLFELLNKKWILSSEEKDTLIRLWPSSSLEVGRLCAVETEASPFLGLSLNKLRKELEDVKGENIVTPSSNGLIMANDAIKTSSAYNVVYPRPFTLTDEIISKGITIKNVAATVVAELYCTCGMKDTIELRYEIDRTAQTRQRTNMDEPWKAMLDMIARDYGEVICGSRREEGDIGIKRKEVDDNCGSSEFEPPPKKSVATVPQPAQESVSAPVVPNIVQQENDDFAKQVMQLKSIRAPRNTRKGSRTPCMRSVAPTPSPQPPPTPQPCVLPPPSPLCKMIPRRTVTSTPRPNNSQTKTLGATAATPRTDFSDIHISPIKKQWEEELQKKRTDNFLGSLKTPQATPQKPTMKTLFGEDISISMSPSNTRKSAVPIVDDEGSRCELTDILFGEISNTPTKFASQSRNAMDMDTSQDDLGFSVTEVQQSYVDMITSSQDSRDFVMQHFKPKPKK